MINDRTRREYRRLLITYALGYFAPEERLRDLDRQRLRGFGDWLCRLTGVDGHRLTDRSVRNAVLPLQSCLLASTGLRISEAIAPRVMDADLGADTPKIHVRRAIVDGQLTGPKSRHGRRTIPISRAPPNGSRPLSPSATTPSCCSWVPRGPRWRPGNLRYRVMIPAAERAGVPWARFHTLRQTCAAVLMDAGASPLRLQRWIGHHSAAFTLDNYGHLIDDGLGPHLSLEAN